MSAADYKELRRWLPKGRITELAKLHGRDRNTISRHLNGRFQKIDLDLMEEVTAEVLEKQNLILTRMRQIHENARLINELSK